MEFIEIAMVAVLVGVFLVLISPRVRASAGWSATVTPLASIIGSGFLVSVPLMASSVGIWAIPAVAMLTGMAYCLGDAIRYNIRHGEKEFADHDAAKPVASVEMLSHLVLIGAYFISVAYYLVLLSAFGLKLLQIDDPLIGKLVSTALILTIAGIGATKGLSGVERAEKFTVSANLAAIAALLVSLVIFGLSLPQGYSWTAAVAETHTYDLDTIRFLLGLLIIVQGFETTRFMGELYPPEARITAMKRAQILSSVVYLIFFILMLPLFPYFKSSSDVAGFIGEIGRVSLWLPIIVAGGAIASQFSAAVADSIGASGLVHDTSAGRISSKHAYIVIGLVAVMVVWHSDVVRIVSLASRAFACFYFLQCVVAILLANARGEGGRRLWFGMLAALCLVVAVFGVPAGG